MEILRNRNGAVGLTVLPVKGKLDAFGGLRSKTGNGKDAFSLPMSNSEFGTSQQVAKLPDLQRVEFLNRADGTGGSAMEATTGTATATTTSTTTTSARKAEDLGSNIDEHSGLDEGRSSIVELDSRIA